MNRREKPGYRHLNLSIDQTTHEALKVWSSRLGVSVRAAALELLQAHLRKIALLAPETEEHHA